MSKKVVVQEVQPVVDGPKYGKVSDPVDFAKSQNYAHAHIEAVTRIAIMTGGAGAQVSGFELTLTSGLGFSVASGAALSLTGKLYDANPDPTVLALGAAHATLPRVDLVYLLLEEDVEALVEFRPYERLPTEMELAAGSVVFDRQDFNQPQELHTRATVQVRAGTPNGSPVAPAANANEIALYTIRVDAAAVALTNDKVTDVRPIKRSLAQITIEHDALEDAFEIIEAIVNAATSLNVPNTIIKRNADGVFAAGPLSFRAFIGPVGGTNPSGLLLETGQLNGDTTELVIMSLHGAASGGPKLALQGVPAQNCHRFKIYNNRGGSPGSDILRYMNDEFGTTHLYGNVSIEADSQAIAGNLSISGSISKGSGTFLIDHPLDPEGADLYHGFVESPRHDLIYRGRVQLKKGEAVVDIDQASRMRAGTFAAITQNVQFLPLNNETDWDRVRVRPGSLQGGKFIVESENKNSNAFVTWVVIAERNDPYIRHTDGTDDDGHLLVEVKKEEVDPTTALAPRIEPVEVDDDKAEQPEESRDEIVPELIGKRGFPRHAAAIGGKLPKRKVTTRFAQKEKRRGDKGDEQGGQEKSENKGKKK